MKVFFCPHIFKVFFYPLFFLDRKKRINTTYDLKNIFINSFRITKIRVDKKE